MIFMRFKEIKQQNIKGLQSNELTADFTNKHLSGETHDLFTKRWCWKQLISVDRLLFTCQNLYSWEGPNKNEDLARTCLIPPRTKLFSQQDGDFA